MAHSGPPLKLPGIEVQVDPLALVDARAVANWLTGFGLVLANTILTWRAIYAARARQVPCLWCIQSLVLASRWRDGPPGWPRRWALPI